MSERVISRLVRTIRAKIVADDDLLNPIDVYKFEAGDGVSVKVETNLFNGVVRVRITRPQPNIHIVQEIRFQKSGDDVAEPGTVRGKQYCQDPSGKTIKAFRSNIKPDDAVRIVRDVGIKA